MSQKARPGFELLRAIWVWAGVRSRAANPTVAATSIVTNILLVVLAAGAIIIVIAAEVAGLAAVPIDIWTVGYRAQSVTMPWQMHLGFHHPHMQALDFELCELISNSAWRLGSY
jgi:hypothetical protein